MDQQEGQQWAVVPWSNDPDSSDVAAFPSVDMYAPATDSYAFDNNPAVNPSQAYFPINAPPTGAYDPNNPAINPPQPPGPVNPIEATNRIDDPSQARWGVAPLQNENIGQHTQPQSELQELRNRFMALKVEHSKLYDAKATADSRLTELQHQLQSLHGHYSSLHEQYNALQDKNQALRGEYGTMQGDLAELTAVHAAAGEDGDKARKFIEELKRARDEAVLQRQITGDKLRKLRVENADLKDDKRCLEQELLYANQQIKLLQTQMAGRQNAVDKQREEHRQDSREATGKLRSENQVLREANKAMEDQLKEANQQIQGLAAKCADLMDRTNAELEMHHAGDKLGFLRKENGDLRDAKLALTDQLRQANQSLQKEKAKNEAQEYNRKVQALEGVCSDLKSVNEELRSDRANLETLIRGQEEKLQDAERKSKGAEDLRAELGNLKRLNADAEDAAEQMKAQNTQLRRASVTAQERVTDMQKNLISFQENQDNLQEQLDKANDRVSGLDSENSTLKVDRKLLQKQLKEERKELEKLRPLNRSLHNELQALKAERRSTENLAETTEQQLKAAMDTIGALEAKLKLASIFTKRNADKLHASQENEEATQSLKDALLEELAKAKSANAKTQGELQTVLEHNLMELKAAHETMKGELLDANKEIEALEAGMSKTVAREKKSLETELETARDKAKGTNEKLKAAKEALAEKEAEISTLKADLSTQEQEKDKAMAETKNLKEQLSESQSAGRELQALADQLKQEAEKAQNEKQEVTSQLAELERVVGKYQTMISQLEADAGEIVERQKMIDEENQSLRTERTKLQEALDGKSSDHSHARDALQKTESLVEKYSENLKQLEHDLGKAHEEIGRLEKEIGKLRVNNAEALEALRSDHGKEKERLQKEIEEQSIKNANHLKAAKSECLELRADRDSTSTKLEEARHEADKLQKSNDRQQKKISALEDEIIECRDENEALEAKQRKQAKAMGSLKSEKDDIEAELESARDGLREKDASQLNSKKLIEKQSQRISELEEREKTLERESAGASKQVEELKSEQEQQYVRLDATARDLAKTKASKSSMESALKEEFPELNSFPSVREVVEAIQSLKLKLQEARKRSRELDHVKNEIADLTESRDATNQENENLRKQIADLDDKLRKQTADLRHTRSLSWASDDTGDARKEIEDLRRQMADLDRSKEAALRESGHLRRQISESEDAVRRENEQLRRQISDLDISKDAALRESASTTREHDRLRKQIAVLDQSQHAANRENEQLRKRIADMDEKHHASRRESDRLRKTIAELENLPRSLQTDARNDSAALSRELEDRKDELLSLQNRYEDLGKAHQGLVKASRDAAVALSSQLEDRNQEYEELRRKFRNTSSEHIAAKEKLLKLEDENNEKEESLKHLCQKLDEARTEINGLKPERDRVRLELEEARAARDSALESKRVQEDFLESLRERLKSDGHANNEKNERLTKDLLLTEKALSENELQLEELKSKLRQMALDKRSLNKDYMDATKRIGQLESQLDGSRQAYSEATADKDITSVKLMTAEAEMEKLVETLAYVENDFNKRESESQTAYQNLLNRAEKLEETLESELNLVRGKLGKALSSNTDLQSCCDRAESDLKAVARELNNLLQPHNNLPSQEPQEGEDDDPLKAVVKVKAALDDAINSREEAVECKNILQKALEEKETELEGKQGELGEKKRELVEARSAFAREKEKLMKDLDSIEADVQKVSGENKELLGHLRSKLNDAEGQGEKLQSQLKDAEGKGDKLYDNLVAARKAKKHLLGENEELKKRLDEATAAVGKLKEKASKSHAADEFATLRAENESLQESLRKALKAIEEIEKPGAQKAEERTFALELTLADRDKRLKEVLSELQQKDSEQENLHKEALKLKWFLEEFLDEAKQLVKVLKEAVDDPQLDRLNDSLDSSRKSVLERLEGLVKHFETEFEDRNEHSEDPVKMKEGGEYRMSPAHSEADDSSAGQPPQRVVRSDGTGESPPPSRQASKLQPIAMKSPSSFRLNLPPPMVHGKASPRYTPQGRAPSMATPPESAIPPVTRNNGGPKAQSTSCISLLPTTAARPASTDKSQAAYVQQRLAASTASALAKGHDQNPRLIGGSGAPTAAYQPRNRHASSGGRSLANSTLSGSQGAGNESTKSQKSFVDPPTTRRPTKRIKDKRKESATAMREESPQSKLDRVRWTTAALS